MENSDFYLNIDSEFTLDTKVYRIVDFYSAADLITAQKFMVPSSKYFEDINDGIGQLMSTLYNTWPQSGCGVSWKNKEDLEKSFANTKESTFVSCWSTNPDSVAMWSLYSKDLSSIRIETTIGKLAELCKNLANEYNFGHFNNLNDGDSVSYFIDGAIHKVKYRDLYLITQKIKRRVKARKRLEQRLLRNGKDTKILGSPMYKSNEKDRSVDGLSSTDLRHLKDSSFKHEEEVRIHLPIHQQKLDQHFLNTIRKDDLAERRENSFNHINSEFPERIFINTPDDFICSVSIDPRAPEYQKVFIEKYFKSKGVQIKQSKCFKSALSYIDVYPWEINPNQ